MTNFKSVSNAIYLEKTLNKGGISLVVDFISDLKTDSEESVKKALKDALKKEGFIPSNTFAMKSLNTAIGLVNAGIESENAINIMSFCRIKASEGEKISFDKIKTAINKCGSIETLIQDAIKASTDESKKASRTASAKKGAKTRSLNKKSGGIVPQAVRAAAIAADSSKEEARQAATPAARLDRAVNAFLALENEGKKQFIRSMWSELIPLIKAESQKRQKKVA